jgi:hypothetical protein
MVLKAIADGVVFEIAYAPAMRSAGFSSSATSSDGGGGGRLSGEVPKEARRNVIAGARELVRVANGKGVIMSSEVRRALEMRGPNDLVNLCVSPPPTLYLSHLFVLILTNKGVRYSGSRPTRQRQLCLPIAVLPSYVAVCIPFPHFQAREVHSRKLILVLLGPKRQIPTGRRTRASSLNPKLSFLPTAPSGIPRKGMMMLLLLAMNLERSGDAPNEK